LSPASLAPASCTFLEQSSPRAVTGNWLRDGRRRLKAANCAIYSAPYTLVYHRSTQKRQLGANCFLTVSTLGEAQAASFF